MILRNVVTIGSDEPVSMMIDDGKISAVSEIKISKADEPVLHFEDAMIFPGLINSHDHLDFNLFPQLGDQIYNNYTEWGNSIHQLYADEIAAVLKIPVELRARWGMFKNLLCGVTTVVNHGEYLKLSDPLINVYQDCQSLHSVQFQKHWRLKLNDPRRIRQSVAIHTGEGTDDLARTEIDELIRWNLLKRKLIGIHGVAMSESQAQAQKFKALVWCPQSNFYLLNRTANIPELKKQTEIIFGTDSTLTGCWDIWDHLRQARKTGLMNDQELYDSLNINPARTWKLTGGALTAGMDADLVVTRKKEQNSYEAFFAIGPEDIFLVMHQGEIRLFDESLLGQLPDISKKNFSRVYVNGIAKQVAGDLPGLMRQIKQYQPEITFPVQTD